MLALRRVRRPTVKRLPYRSDFRQSSGSLSARLLHLRFLADPPPSRPLPSSVAGLAVVPATRAQRQMEGAPYVNLKKVSTARWRRFLDSQV